MLNGRICAGVFSTMFAFLRMLGNAAFVVALVAAIFGFGDLLFTIVVVVDVCDGYGQNGFMRLRGGILVSTIGFFALVKIALNLHSGKWLDGHNHIFAARKKELIAHKTAKQTISKIAETLLTPKEQTDECNEVGAERQRHFAVCRADRGTASGLLADKSRCGHRNRTRKCAQAMRA